MATTRFIIHQARPEQPWLRPSSSKIVSARRTCRSPRAARRYSRIPINRREKRRQKYRGPSRSRARRAAAGPRARDEIRPGGSRHVAALAEEASHAHQRRSSPPAASAARSVSPARRRQCVLPRPIGGASGVAWRATSKLYASARMPAYHVARWHQ